MSEQHKHRFTSKQKNALWGLWRAHSRGQHLYAKAAHASLSSLERRGLVRKAGPGNSIAVPWAFTDLGAQVARQIWRQVVFR